MSRTVYLVRHGSTDANRANRALFGASGAGLNAAGIVDATIAGKKLTQLKLKSSQTVAVSDKIRTQQTALHAGFKNQKIYPLLGEIKTDDAEQTAADLEKGVVPAAALKQMQKLLANPPAETIWFTHGLVVAALRIMLKQTDGQSLVPACGEMVVLRLALS